MNNENEKIVYNTLLASFVDDRIIRDIGLKENIGLQDLVFIEILKKANKVVEEFDKNLEDIFEDAEEQRKNNNVEEDISKYEEIEKKFKIEFDIDRLYEEGIVRDKTNSHKKFSEEEINNKVQEFYQNWKALFLKKVNKDGKVSFVKYSYFHLIDSLFNEINNKFDFEIQKIADFLLGEFIDKKNRKIEKRTAKEHFVDLLKEGKEETEIPFEKLSRKKLQKRVFLSYSVKDKLYTLLLFTLAKKYNVFLSVDWMINDVDEDGSNLKNVLFRVLNSADNLLFLRTLNSEFNVKGVAQVRQWCSWEIGTFYHKNDGDINSSILRFVDTGYLTGDEDKRFEKMENEEGHLIYRPVVKKGKKEKGKANELFLDGITVENDISKYFASI